MVLLNKLFSNLTRCKHNYVIKTFPIYTNVLVLFICWRPQVMCSIPAFLPCLVWLTCSNKSCVRGWWWYNKEINNIHLRLIAGSIFYYLHSNFATSSKHHKVIFRFSKFEKEQTRTQHSRRVYLFIYFRTAIVSYTIPFISLMSPTRLKLATFWLMRNSHTATRLYQRLGVSFTTSLLGHHKKASPVLRSFLDFRSVQDQSNAEI